GDRLPFDVSLAGGREARRQFQALDDRRGVLQSLRHEERGEAGNDQEREDRSRQRIGSGQSSPPRANRSTVSERRPKRSVSSERTSSAAMFPRLQSVPKRRSSHTCCSRSGASKIKRPG